MRTKWLRWNEANNDIKRPRVQCGQVQDKSLLYLKLALQCQRGLLYFRSIHIIFQCALILYIKLVLLSAVITKQSLLFLDI